MGRSTARSTDEQLGRQWLAWAAKCGDRAEAVRLARSFRYWAKRLDLTDPGDIDGDLAGFDLPDVVALRSRLRQSRHLLQPLGTWRSAGASLLLRIRDDPALGGLAAQAADDLGESRLIPRWPLPDTGSPAFHRQLQHPGGVDACAFTRDGSRLVTAGGGRILLWDVGTASVLHSFPGPAAEPGAEAAQVEDICVAPDGSWLGTMHTPGKLGLSVGRPGALRIWELPRLTPRHLLTDSAEWPLGCAASRDGRLFVSYHADRLVCCWDPASGTMVSELRGATDPGRVGESAPAALSADGTWLALTNVDGSVELRDTRTAAVLRRLIGHPQPVTELVIAPDDRWLATTDGRSLRIWDVETGACLRTVDTSPHPCVGLATDPGGRWVAACTGARGIQVVSARPDGHDRAAGTAHAAPAGGGWLRRRLAARLANVVERAAVDRGTFTGGYCLVDRTGSRIVSLTGLEYSDHGGQQLWFIHVASTWDPETGRLLATRDFPDDVKTGVLDPDGRWLATIRADRIQILDPATMQPQATVEGASSAVTAYAAHLGAGWLATGHGSGAVRLLRPGLAAGSVPAEPAHLQASVDLEKCFVPPHGRWLLTRAGRRFAVRDPATGAIRRQFSGETTGVFLNGAWRLGCVTTDGSLAYTVDDDGTLRTWDPDSGQQLATQRGSNGEEFVIEQVPPGWLATAVDGRLRLRDRLGRLRQDVPAHPMRPAVAAHGGDWLATQSDTGVHIWDADSGRTIAVLPGETRPVALPRPGAPYLLLTMDAAGRVLLRDPATDQPPTPFGTGREAAEPQDRIAAVDPAGRWFVHLRGAALERWDIASGTVATLGQPSGPAAPDAVAASPDGRLLAVAGPAGLLRFFAATEGREHLAIRLDSSLRDICWLPDSATVLTVGSAGAYLLSLPGH